MSSSNPLPKLSLSDRPLLFSDDLDYRPSSRQHNQFALAPSLTSSSPTSDAAVPHPPNSARVGQTRKMDSFAASLAASTLAVNRVLTKGQRVDNFSHADVYSGSVDVWPGGLSSFRKTTIQHSASRTRSAEHSLTPRPRFLVELETFIDKELTIQGLKEAPPSQERLQIFRQAWEYLMEDFRTYRPLLASIKAEYEQVLSKYEARLQMLPSLKARLSSLKQETAHLVAQMKHEHELVIQQMSQEIVDLKTRNESLGKTDSELREENERLKFDLEDFREKYLDMHEKNYTLVKHMRYYQEQVEEIRKNEQAEEKNKQQMAALLEDAHNDVARLQKELDDLRLVMDRMVPKASYDSVQEETKLLQQDLAHSRSLYSTLEAEHQQVSAMYEELTVQRQYSTRQSTEANGRPMTPRPQWEKYLPEMKRKLEVSLHSKSSDEISNALCQEIDKLHRELQRLREQFGLDDGEDRASSAEQVPDFFTARTGPGVPKFLQWNGKVRNKKIPKRDCELIVYDCLQQKAKDGQNVHLQDYFYNYLKKKHGIQSMVVEMGYSMLDALKRYSSDADCWLFLLVINGEMPEDVVADHQALLSEFERRLASVDRKNNFGKQSGKLTKKEIMREVAYCCPNKPESHLNSLRKALAQESEGGVLEYTKLFEQDRELNQSQFLNLLRRQHLQESIHFHQQLETAVKALDMQRTGIVNLSAIRECIKSLDPNKSDAEVDRMVARGFNLSVENLAPDLDVPLEKFLPRLFSGLCKRSSPKSGKITPGGSERPSSVSSASPSPAPYERPGSTVS